ncbi:MAG: hypothetical protein ACTSUJ_07895 [Candidatus Njordarchaeales archaeon]
MLHAVFLLDSSGTPIYVWKSEEIPSQIFKGKDENLVASFVSALLNFGQETFAAPQRIDFRNFALSFFTFKIRDKVFWIAAVSDIEDHQRATNNVLRSLAEKLVNEIEEAQLEEGLIMVTDELKDRFEDVIEEILRKHTRILPNIRSSLFSATIFSLLISLPLTFALYYMLRFLFIEILSALLMINPVTYAFAFVTIFGILTGIICGISATNSTGGFISSFICSLTALALSYSEIDLLVIVTLALTVSLLSGLVGMLVGYWRDTATLKLSRIPKEELLKSEEIELEEGELEALEEFLKE